MLIWDIIEFVVKALAGESGKKDSIPRAPKPRGPNIFDQMVDRLYRILAAPENVDLLVRVRDAMEAAGEPFQAYRIAPTLLESIAARDPNFPRGDPMLHPRDFTECLQAALGRIRGKGLMPPPSPPRAPVDVVLADTGDHRLWVINVLRGFARMELSDAVQAADSAPVTVWTGVDATQVRLLREQLEAAGATVRVESQQAVSPGEGPRAAAAPAKVDAPPAAAPPVTTSPKAASGEDVSPEVVPTAPVDDGRRYDVILEATGNRVIQVLQKLVALTGLNLSDVRKLVVAGPVTVLSGARADAARAARDDLARLGAQVRVEPPLDG